MSATHAMRAKGMQQPHAARRVTEKKHESGDLPRMRPLHWRNAKTATVREARASWCERELCEVYSGALQNIFDAGVENTYELQDLLRSVANQRSEARHM
jgi:hypothetical protein